MIGAKHLAALIVTIAVLWSLYSWAYQRGYSAMEAICDNERAEAVTAALAAINRNNQASIVAARSLGEKLETALPAITREQNDAIEKIRIVYRDNPVPRLCIRPDSVREHIEQARQRANAAAN